MSEITERPWIGITGRRIPGARISDMEPRYQARDIYMYFDDFSRAVAEAGGIPLLLPYEADAGVFARLDGLIVTGGQDVCPAQWGGGDGDAHQPVDPDRDRYELDLINGALTADVPLLGICRGMQLINVALGGTLVPDLPRDLIDHQASGQPVDALAHRVDFTAGTTAFGVYGYAQQVNSLHHQAVDRCGEGVVITGRAEDGTAEALEIPGRQVLGVQWHPEWMPRQDRSFKWLVLQASELRRRPAVAAATR